MRYLVTIFLLLSHFSFAQRFDFGLGGVYGTEIQEPGVNARFYVNSNDHRFCFGPELTVFSTHKKDLENGFTEAKELWEFNFNAHINFMLLGHLGFYPLIGLNYSHEKEELQLMGVSEDAVFHDAFGLNLGLGLHYDLPKHWILFLEYDYLISDLTQSTLTFGVLVGFGKIKGREKHDAVLGHH